MKVNFIDECVSPLIAQGKFQLDDIDGSESEEFVILGEHFDITGVVPFNCMIQLQKRESIFGMVPPSETSQTAPVYDSALSDLEAFRNSVLEAGIAELAEICIGRPDYPFEGQYSGWAIASTQSEGRLDVIHYEVTLTVGDSEVGSVQSTIAIAHDGDACSSGNAGNA